MVKGMVLNSSTISHWRFLKRRPLLLIGIFLLCDLTSPLLGHTAGSSLSGHISDQSNAAVLRSCHDPRVQAGYLDCYDSDPDSLSICWCPAMLPTSEIRCPGGITRVLTSRETQSQAIQPKMGGSIRQRLLTPSFSYGNAPRNFLRSSHVADADISLFKSFRFANKPHFPFAPKLSTS